ncbi:RNase adapter RapZ [Rhodobaculum claviforme]|uniref:RNase adaptor protein RapZ n=1 Tax=Rhodobaculum claviforme TaxID=1549854 RepID=A0A934TJW8_9RHOB|nr:RNase adapter RapZ [Rhodobaculum claviforme]MBK5926801.1 RNase adaptor protein RapZ [Rhodobaculum claviforme]
MTQTPPIAPIAPVRPAPGWRVVCVIGPAGAGRTTALNALEDLGFQTITNMPLELLPHLLAGPAQGRPLALGLDVGMPGFAVTAFLDLVAEIDADPRASIRVVYLDCRPEALLRRFSETRRRHPSAPADHPADGIAREHALLAPVRDRADIAIDTSDMSPHDLRAEMARWFGGDGTGLAVSLQSFSYKRGVPRGLDMVFDCRFLRNPYWVPELRGGDGRCGAVAAHIRSDPRYAPFLAQINDLLALLLPAHAEEGKTHLGIGFGCTGGQHRSVMVVETLAEGLAKAGWQVSKRHREVTDDPVTPQGRAGTTPGDAEAK